MNSFYYNNRSQWYVVIIFWKYLGCMATCWSQDTRNNFKMPSWQVVQHVFVLMNVLWGPGLHSAVCATEGSQLKTCLLDISYHCHGGNACMLTCILAMFGFFLSEPRGLPSLSLVAPELQAWWHAGSTLRKNTATHWCLWHKKTSYSVHVDVESHQITPLRSNTQHSWKSPVVSGHLKPIHFWCLFTTIQLVSGRLRCSLALIVWKLVMGVLFIIVVIKRVFPVLPVSQIMQNSVLMMGSHVSRALSCCGDVSEENESGISGFISEIKPFTNYFLPIHRPALIRISVCFIVSLNTHHRPKISAHKTWTSCWLHQKGLVEKYEYIWPIFGP